ncbi:hypothetical protein AVEN_99902-1 [Araneus ventricosus]|uniref:Uncharacterized protein n=1 Tax=Araneus ventricosus TaxID=182803 RepID=A0A4Y2PW29_ARAVE|nr:hypothetical protein AVEN_99902-1 [Araneus ventricosus]
MADILFCRQKKIDASQGQHCSTLVLAQQLYTTMRRQMSLFPLARCLYKDVLYNRRPEHSVLLTALIASDYNAVRNAKTGYLIGDVTSS